MTFYSSGLLLCLATAVVLATAAALSDYTCTPGILPSPGVSLPRGDISLVVGGPPLRLTCHLNPAHEYYAMQGYRAGQLSFWTPGDGTLEANVEDDATISAEFIPSAVGVRVVQCLLSNATTRQRLGICSQKIFTGYPPLPVQDFSCLSDNWHSLNCTWHEPPNPVETSYSVAFIEPGANARPRSCPSSSYLEDHLGHPVPEHSCYIDLTTEPPYRQTIQTFSFYFNASNRLVPDGVISRFTVNHFAVVRPAPPVGVRLEAVSASQLNLTYTVPRELFHFGPGLVHSVEYRSEWDNEAGSWSQLDTASIPRNLTELQLALAGLAHPFTNYTVRIRLLSGSANRTNQQLWSEEVDVWQRTRPSPPLSSPATNIGSFEVMNSGSGPNTRTILVYWQLLPLRNRNGPDFHYQVMDEESGTVPSSIHQSYARFDSAASDRRYNISLRAANSAGATQPESRVLVPSSEELAGLAPRSLTKIYTEAGRFQVAWRPPTSSRQVVSYTLFWCLALNHKDRPHQCDGPLDWKTIQAGGGDQNETISHDLLLPVENSIYQIAVAANTPHISSGMVWAACTVIQGRLEAEVNHVEVLHPSSTGLWVRWQLECSDQAGIVYGYRVEYCYISGSVEKCGNLDTAPDQNAVHLRDLEPYTHYRVGVRIKSGKEMAFGRIGRTVVARTLSAPPSSPPRNVTLSGITASAATLSWSPPEKANGEIYEYVVQVAYTDSQGRRVGTQRFHVTNTTETVLENLLSYTRYLVNVSGCTVLEGSGVSRLEDGCSLDHAAEATFLTRIGPPAQALPPTVEFINSTLVKVAWSPLFQIGAPEALQWQLRTLRVGPGWEEEHPYLVNVSGPLTEATLSLNMVNDIKGWSPDCENATNTNKFDFAVQVIVGEPESGKQFSGPWSEAVTVAAYCSPALSWTIIIVVCVVVAVMVVVAVLLVCRASHWWLIKKDFFDKLGKELDAKIVLASVDSLEGGGGASGGGHEYELRHFDIRMGGGEDGKEDPGDTDTLLLKGGDAAASPSSSPLQQPQPPPHYRQKSSASESAQSDFTSSGFGGSSQGCTSTGTAPNGIDSSDCCVGRLRQDSSETGSGSATTGYISMMGGSGLTANYTQLALARPRTLSGPTQSPRPASYCALNSDCGGSRPSSMPPAVSTNIGDLQTMCEEPAAVATNGSDPLPTGGQLSLSDWNSFPGYSLVTTNTGTVADNWRPITNGYVSAPPHTLVTTVEAHDVQGGGGPGYISVQQARELVLAPSPGNQPYCSFVSRGEPLKVEAANSHQQQSGYIPPSFV